MAEPALKIFSPEPAIEEAAFDSTRKHNILVVDDEELLIKSLKQTLDDEGYKVSTALNALDAMKLLRNEQYSVVMSDQKMPQMTGLEFLSQAKQIQPEATRILITGVIDLHTVIEAINKGEIYRFIVKPWIREELLASVNNGVQRHELICRNRELQKATHLMNEQLTALNQSLEQKLKVEASYQNELTELNKALEENLQRSVEICLRTLSTFYPSLGNQATKVHKLCVRLSECFQLTPKQRQILELSAWLHDIGLVGIPRRLIKLWHNNPSALNPAEITLIQQHPILGQELADFIHNLNEVGIVIRCHHEHFDGSGYPDGIGGEKIPWLGRILAIAVAFVSNVNGEETALAEMRRFSGIKYDPEIVRALERCLQSIHLSACEKEILLSELQPGMILAKGIYGANGLLLMPEGQELSEVSIIKLRNHHRVNPIKQRLLVYC